MNRTLFSLWIALALPLATTELAKANPITELLKAGGRAAMRKGGGAAVRQGAKQATKQAARKTARTTVQSAAKARAAQASRHFSDDAVRVGGRLTAAAPAYADDLAKVSASLTARNHRRLMMLAPELKRTGKAGEVVRKLSVSGNADEAVEFLWRHRGKLAAGAATAAFVVHGDDVVKTAGETIAQPLIEGSIEHVAKPIVSALAKGLFVCAVVLGLAAAFKLAALRRSWRALLRFGRASLRSLAKRS